MSTHLLRSILVVIAFAAMITVNALANSLPINGITTGEVSRSVDVRFVPAGYVFSIWGLIYLALMAFTGNLLRPAIGAQPWAGRVGVLFALSCFVNAGWMFAWHYQRFALTVVLMLALLGLLIAMYLLVGVGRAPRSRGQRWLVEAPIQLYLGWIAVATVANVSTMLLDLGWEGGVLSQDAWAAVMLAVTVLLAVLMVLTRRDAIFTGVLAWATVGIAVAQADSTTVRISAWTVCVIAIGLTVAGAVWRPVRSPLPRT